MLSAPKTSALGSRCPAPAVRLARPSGAAAATARPRFACVRVKAAEEVAAEAAADTPNPNVCKTCGVPLSEKPGGCDGEGRVAGGVGAIAGFQWWPIKAYRPCEKLSEKGINYRRKGQITDEMLFGKDK